MWIDSVIVNQLTEQFLVTFSTGTVNWLPAELILSTCCCTGPHSYESSEHLQLPPKRGKMNRFVPILWIDITL